VSVARKSFLGLCHFFLHFFHKIGFFFTLCICVGVGAVLGFSVKIMIEGWCFQQVSWVLQKNLSRRFYELFES